MEVFYPSSTTLLVLNVIPSLWLQMDRWSKSGVVRTLIRIFVVGFSAFLVLGRLTDGIHWATDIIGAALLSCGMYLLYLSTVRFSHCRRNS